jgi:cysteine desulfurase/selenocysteine lyase
LSRLDFPIFQKKKNLIYFDSAATSQKPQCVIDAISHFYEEEYGTVHRGVYELTRSSSRSYLEARKTIAEFIHAKSPDEIIFTRGATSALNLVARSFGKAFIKEGDKILVTEIEHHANLVPWQMMAEERKASVEYIPVNDEGEINLKALEKLCDEKVKLISIAHVSNVIGVKHPIKKIIEIAKSRGIKVCIDGAQSIGHSKINVVELDCDFFVFSGHKIYGPTGIGVLWGKKELLDLMPPIEGGGDMIDQVTLERTTYAPLPLKFEAGTPPIASVMGLKAALDYLRSVGLDRLEVHENELTTYCLQKLKQIKGIKIIGRESNRGPIISFVVEGVHPLDLGTMLDCKGIAIRTGHHCSQPAMKRFGITSCCRLSFGIYNTKEEILSLYSTTFLLPFCLENCLSTASPYQ